MALNALAAAQMTPGEMPEVLGFNWSNWTPSRASRGATSARLIELRRGIEYFIPIWVIKIISGPVLNNCANYGAPCLPFPFKGIDEICQISNSLSETGPITNHNGSQ